MNLNAHLSELPAAEAAAFRTLVARLQAAPQREPSPQLASRILAAVASERTQRPTLNAQPITTNHKPVTSNYRLWRWAAALAAGLLAALTLFDRPAAPQPADPAADPAAWLAASQEADGAWQPARHGGDPAYRPALTALAALALARDPADRFRAGVRRATDALVALQTADGAFGGEGRVRAYNQAIAAYALATLAPHGPATAAALERAVAFSRAGQSAEGGWDYEAGSEGGVAYHRGSAGRSESLSALAAYTLMTSGRAFDGLPTLGRHLTDTLSAADGAADCYRDYAKVMAFESAGDTARAEAVRTGMRHRRQAGAQDPWEPIGGTLYTCAFTALAARQ
ncbi:MAG: hypothetical protein BWX70_02846 [Verrucomicrobia bacterium ADurb.Bin070]|nr:MAG: hypothetical protein BWX70_02846 [Verrucomicrobia bacterium ADurb.Bin070]